jgi:cytochrome c
METLPIPRDIPLPLPGGDLLFQILLVAAFLIHILFVDLMLGGTLLALVYEVRGLHQRSYDRLAREVAATVTWSKSMAVVLGVAPLLVINVYYTIYFYSANALTGEGWIMVVPLVAAAFLLTYAYRYSWDRLERRKGLHIAIGAAGAGLLLVVPFIFLANVNLMLFPERWPEVAGFFSAVTMSNVIPRYFHFLVATIAVTGLFLAGYFGRHGFPVEERLQGLSRDELRRHFLAVGFGATGLQLVFGPLLFFTLPPKGQSWVLVLTILVALVLVVGLLWLLWRELHARREQLGRTYWLAIAAVSVVVVLMGSARHFYREVAVEPHRRLVAERTESFQAAALGARMRAAAGMARVGGEEEGVPLGQRVFQTYCAACHARGKRLVGPPVEEIAAPYQDDLPAMMEWIRAPGKKRPDYPQMPAISLPSADRYRAVAEHVLELAGTGPEED